MSQYLWAETFKTTVPGADFQARSPQRSDCAVIRELSSISDSTGLRSKVKGHGLFGRAAEESLLARLRFGKFHMDEAQEFWNNTRLKYVFTQNALVLKKQQEKVTYKAESFRPAEVWILNISCLI